MATMGGVAKVVSTLSIMARDMPNVRRLHDNREEKSEGEAERDGHCDKYRVLRSVCARE